MVRTITPSLLQAQAHDLGRPYVRVEISSKVGTIVATYDNIESGRVYSAVSIEEPYSGGALILLRNNDGALTNLDFRGHKVFIGWGYTTPGGNEFSSQQPVWVIDQSDVSAEGELLVELRCFVAWEMLRYSTGINLSTTGDFTNPIEGTIGAGSPRAWNRSHTIQQIVEEIITDPNCWLAQWGLVYDGLQGVDPFVDTYKPLIITEINDDDRLILRRVLEMSGSILSMRHDGIRLVHLNPLLDGPYYTFDLGGQNHPFYESVRGRTLPIPNRVFFGNATPNISSGQKATFVGEAVNQESIDAVGTLARIFVDDSINSDDEAGIRATSKMSKINAESIQGIITVPMNCTMELFDEIQVVDSRGGPSIINRAGRLERTFKSDTTSGVEQQRGTYDIAIQLGGLTSGNRLGGGQSAGGSFLGVGNPVQGQIGDLGALGLENPFPVGGQTKFIGPFVVDQSYVDGTTIFQIPPGIFLKDIYWILGPINTAMQARVKVEWRLGEYIFDTQTLSGDVNLHRLSVPGDIFVVPLRLAVSIYTYEALNFNLVFLVRPGIPNWRLYLNFHTFNRIFAPAQGQ